MSYFIGMVDVDYSFYPNKEFQLEWLRVYLTNYHKNDNIQIDDDYVHRLYLDVNKFAFISLLLWVLWGLIQAEHSTIEFDFIKYVLD